MNNGKSTASTPHSTPAPRKPYQRPTLRRLGDFHTLTRTSPDGLFPFTDTLQGEYYIS